MQRPPGAGWTPAPQSKIGAYRKPAAHGRWIYWTPDKGPHEQDLAGDRPVDKIIKKHAEQEAIHLLGDPVVHRALEVADRAARRFGPDGLPKPPQPADVVKVIHDLANKVRKTRTIQRAHEIQERTIRYAAEVTKHINDYERRQLQLVDEIPTDMPRRSRAKPKITPADKLVERGRSRSGEFPSEKPKQASLFTEGDLSGNLRLF